MGGSQKQKSGPSQAGQFGQGAFAEGLYGPGTSDSLTGRYQEGAIGGGEAVADMFTRLDSVANGPGFFDGVTGDPSNPFNNAYTTLNDSFSAEGSQIQGGVASGAGASGATATAGTINQPDAIISQSQTDQATNKLLNPPSVFDTMSGGPIVDAINARSDASSAAYTTKMLNTMQLAQEAAYSNLIAGGGFVSGSAVQSAQDRITTDIMNDIGVFQATMSLENTRYLGDLAMQDIQNGTNAAAIVLAQAMVQRGQDVESAIQQANMITQAAIASAQNQTQASIASAANSTNASIATANNTTQANIAGKQLAQSGQLGLLGLGQQDNQFGRNMQYEAAQKPIDIGAGLAVGSNISSGSGKGGI